MTNDLERGKTEFREKLIILNLVERNNKKRLSSKRSNSESTNIKAIVLRNAILMI